jgi:hypothetical protein
MIYFFRPWQLNLPEELQCPFPGFMNHYLVMCTNRLYHLPAAADNWIQAGHGLLKDHSDLFTPDMEHLFFIQGAQVDLFFISVKKDTIGRD